jgi:uncharacterized repeat protein (TIGR03837 family)
LQQPAWDIFCRVVDNYGDAAVCWRLARQLHAEHGCQVRLWIDHLAALHALNPVVKEFESAQRVDGVEVRVWRDADFSVGAVHAIDAFAMPDVVVEAFGCRLPDSYAERLASSATCSVAGRPSGKRPIWITLEYLSAEAWVVSHHGLPSPHPRLDIDRYFFFPGFSADTGGLLREGDLIPRRADFQGHGETIDAFWRRIGWPSPSPGATTISLFGYENRQLGALLDVWRNGDSPICLAVTDSRIRPDVLRWLGQGVAGAGESARRGNLEIRFLPFLTQDDYDLLLWSCDWNFVRGEDSFVRAQWAARPCVWHIYPQQENAHGVKLEAFLDHYCADLPTGLQDAFRSLWRVWNGQTADRGAAAGKASAVETGGRLAAAWAQLAIDRGVLTKHASDWSNGLIRQQDLALKLVDFCQKKRSKA